ncbi:response regulator [Kordiimonas sp.]|uniref:response regulator n=1 Tax=Kordiimonas sp. TaxID=1970157 RepID=UPI003A910955
MSKKVAVGTVDGEALVKEAAALLHDLRTPLLTIRTLAVLLDDINVKASPAREIEKQVDRLNERLDAFWRQIEPSADGAVDTVAAEPQATYRVLYVDDDELHRDIGRRLLVQSGCTVVVCANGAEALERCAEESFDLVFLDRNTPILSGLEAARQLSEKAGQIPYLIGMSNDPRGSLVRVECLEAGMQDYFAKPLTVEKLAAVFEGVSSRQRREGQ